MKKEDVITYFGDQSKVAQALDIDPAAVSQWGVLVPEKRAARLERLVGAVKKNGVVLRYDPSLYENHSSSAA